MKIAFITPDVSIYGSSRSLVDTINALTSDNVVDNNILLIYSKTFIKTTSFQNSLFGNNVANAESWILPFSSIYKGADKRIVTLIKNIFRLVLFSFLFNIKYKFKFKDENVDIIHINSIVLWPILLFKPKNTRVIMYIREKLIDNKFSILSYIAKRTILNRSEAIIAIDELTSAPFKGSERLNIIRNPFDMKRAFELKNNNREELIKKYNLPENSFYVSIIGRIEEIKSQHIFLDMVEIINDENISFIIVGDGEGYYLKKITERARKFKNVYLLGEIENIEEVYAVTDVVVKCEDFFQIERTVWEAYYSGCNTLIPADKNENLSEIEEYIGSGIYLYQTRNLKDLVNSLCKIKNSSHKHEQKSFDNYSEFSRKYRQVIDSVMKSL